MPLNLIPNQPFIFESPLYAQDCLNNDNLEYSQMVQPNDTICVQQQMLPCDEEINCEPTMSSGAGASEVGTWTVSGGWSSVSGGFLSYDGTGGVVGTATRVAGSLLAGRAYRIELTVDSITGACVTGGFSISLGIDSTISITETGDYVFYLICQDASDAVTITMTASATTGADTCEISGFNYYNVTDCWQDELNLGSPSWTYSLETDDFLTYAIGKFCSLDNTGGDLINTTAYTIDGNYHRVNVTVSECNRGYVEVILGGVYLGATSGNGDFIFYGVPTDASGELKFVKRDLFDGCLSNATVDEYGAVDNTDLGNAVYKLYVANDSGVAQTDEITFTLFEDRITWCFDVSELTNGGNPIELSCDIVYRLYMTAQCLESELEEYTSVTTLRYNPDGWDCTKVFDASCEGFAFGFYFGSTTARTFSLIQRLRVLQFAPRYPAEGEEYLYSSGENSRQFAQSSKIRTAWFDYCDEPTHDVIRLQVLCDVATIDDVQVFCPVKDYEPEWDEHRRNLAQSKVDMQLVNEPAVFKRNC